jgi:integral membrane sensor domain MASE1/serine phosphatase RsbU (regulator of sigma subunit)
MLSARYALQFAAMVLAYVAFGKFGLGFAYQSSSVTAIWAPTGIALAALVLGGYRLWPAVSVGALLTNLWTGVPAGTVLGITAGNTLEALTGAYLLRSVAGSRPTLGRVRDVISLVVFGALISTAVSATIGVASLAAGDAIATRDLGSVWRTWWLGDMGGDLIVAPAILIAATHWPFTRAPGRAFEAVLLFVLLAAVGIVLFSQSSAMTYLVFPMMVWAALRFWQPGAAAANLLLAVIAVVFTARGRGPFAAAAGPDERLLLAQTFVAVAGTTALILAVVTSQRRQAEERVRDIASTLQESLLPPRLPDLPRLRTATYFRPAGAGDRVGGDFYDVFESIDETFGLALGDVRGKGAPAAALTALARYTLRATALHERLPSRILAALNDAVWREHHGDEFCSVVYATLDVGQSAPTVMIACGGHPLPLLLRAGGAVIQLGEPGMLLGIDPRPKLADRLAQLREGDSVLFYTDGLTDAHAPERVIAVAELEAVLASCAGHSPAEIVEEIERALLEGPPGEPRDDVAMVVLQFANGRRRPGARRT